MSYVPTLSERLQRDFANSAGYFAGDAVDVWRKALRRLRAVAATDDLIPIWNDVLRDVRMRECLERRFRH